MNYDSDIIWSLTLFGYSKCDLFAFLYTFLGYYKRYKCKKKKKSTNEDKLLMQEKKREKTHAIVYFKKNYIMG